MYKVKIKGYEYTIIETNKERDDRLIVNNEYAIGTCHNSKQEIVLLNTVSDKRLKQTLIHELVHAFIEVHGFYNYTFNEEAMCNFIEVYSEDILNIANDYMNQR